MPAVAQPDLFQLTAEIKNRARRLGFDLVGIAPAEAPKFGPYFREWLDDGRHGTMEYLARRVEHRLDPASYLADARSVICVATNYHVPLELVPESERTHHAKIARYALGQDYHEPLKRRLWKLADWIRETVPDAQTRACVDTAPVLEREFAGRAGIGWVGKNTCVINERVGSWLLLGEIITTIALPPDEPAIDRCGTCTRCIDACPTGAITQPYQLEARRCISYLNIEHHGPISQEFDRKLGEWLYGCDICQDVCPWNHKAPVSIDPLFQPRFKTGTIDARQVLGWTEDDYRARLRGSPLRRLKLPVLQRNAAIVAQNLQDRREP
jgi:epoxyqueuosine reductase